MFTRRTKVGALAAFATIAALAPQLLSGPAQADEWGEATPVTIEPQAVQLRAMADRSTHTLATLVTTSYRLRSDAVRELTASRGKVRSAIPRHRLAVAVGSLDENIAASAEVISRSGRARAQARWNVGDTGTVAALLRPTVTEVAASAQSLRSSIKAVHAAQTALEKAIRAAKVAAARKVGIRAAMKPGVGAYTEHVWASGFQTQLNACRGAVNLTGAYGVATIGEKWGCGGSRFPRQGAIVRLTGVMSGLYRVGPVVATLNAYTDSARDIPRGYTLLYQTCAGGDARTETFTQLTRIE